MALDWVRAALEERLGFTPFPATLNLRPVSAADRRLWRAVREEAGIPLLPGERGFCAARLYRVEIRAGERAAPAAAVLVPEVEGYPEDKIEVVAPLRLKDALGVSDGDRLILEFTR